MSKPNKPTPNQEWPRVRDLPKSERKPFTRWLAGQGRPWLDGLALQEQDGYFPWDYERWKRGHNSPQGL